MKPDALGFHYVAVDGPIGVGKTTLVEMLARRYEGVKILEDVDNPFLPDFYQDRPGAAFQTELYFLLSRYKQQQEIAQRELFDKLLVADYTFQKNRIFAYLNLSDDELMLFDKLFALLEPQVPVPDLVIHLVADVDTCLERIRKRARNVERTISPIVLPRRDRLLVRVYDGLKSLEERFHLALLRLLPLPPPRPPSRESDPSGK